MSELQQLVARRGTLGLLARQDVKKSYGHYRLGMLWTLAEPFAMALMMYVVFRFILGSTRGIGLDPFIVYLITGMLPFQWLSQSIRKGPRVFRKYGNMLSFSPLPESVWPMRGVMVGGLEFSMSYPVVFALIFLFGAHITWGVVLLPVAFALQVILGVGAAMLGAALSLRLPDIERLTSVVVRMLFWTSPILWTSKNFPEWLQPWLYLNPFHMILDFYRATVWPTESLSGWENYAKSSIVIIVVFVAGKVLLDRRVRDVRKVN